MKPIPENQFAVLKNVESKSVISSGRHDEMVVLARVMNENYQTDAYKAETWVSHV